jgi:hypothetical protein
VGTSGSTVGKTSGTGVGAASGPFAETVGTPFYRLHTPAKLAVVVITLVMIVTLGIIGREFEGWL